MEFTKLLKHGSAVLFLLLVAHGLVLGFSTHSTILSVVLAGVVCLFEAQLVKSERIESEERFSNAIKEIQHQISKEATKREVEDSILKVKMEADKAEMMERLGQTHSQLNALKLNQGMRKL